MSTTTTKHSTAAELEAKLADLCSRLTTEEQAVTGAQATLEGAMEENKPTEKALGALGDARARRDALASVILKTEAELAAARVREDLEQRLATHRKAEEHVEALGKDLGAKAEKIMKAHDALMAAASDFNRPAEALRAEALSWGIGNAARIIPLGMAYTAFDWAHNPSSDLEAALTVMRGALKGSRESLEYKLAALASDDTAADAPAQ